MTLSHYTHGSGPVRVLCAHSWVASGVSFAPLLTHLDPNAATWIFPDFAGYGLSKDSSANAEITGMGEDLVTLADQLGWETFHLIGHSMGGQAVQGILANEKYRDRVLSAVLISPVPSQGFPLDAESESLFLNAASTPTVMEGVVGTLAGGQHSAGFSQYVTALSEATVDEGTLRKYLRAWTLDDVSEGVSGYEGPVLVLSGELDPVLGPAVAAQIAAQFSDASHHVIPATGHFPPLESPTLVAARIREHVLAQRAKI